MSDDPVLLQPLAAAQLGFAAQTAVAAVGAVPAGEPEAYAA